MNFLGFGQSAEIDIVFDNAENKKTAVVKGEDGKMENMLLFYDGESVSGKVNVMLKKPSAKLEHHGIKIEFIGQIELFYDRGNHHEFKCLAKALARPGDLLQNTSYPFEFPNVEKQFEVYSGSNVRLRYFLRATIVRRISDIVREVDIAVHTLSSYPEMNNPIKMEVGIEDCLHIEFEYNKSKYHLKDTIIGKIYFLLVRIKIKHMEIAIIKRESTGSGANMFVENETIAKYEIMDGAPVKGESIPIRVFLAGYNLTPTMRDINKKFSVKYFLNLVLMDTEDRRYFKQQEITLWRKADIPRYHGTQQQQQLQQLQSLSQAHMQKSVSSNLTPGSALPTNDPEYTQGNDFERDYNAETGTQPEPSVGLFTCESPTLDNEAQQRISSTQNNNLASNISAISDDFQQQQQQQLHGAGTARVIEQPPTSPVSAKTVESSSSSSGLGLGLGFGQHTANPTQTGGAPTVSADAVTAAESHNALGTAKSHSKPPPMNVG